MTEPTSTIKAEGDRLTVTTGDIETCCRNEIEAAAAQMAQLQGLVWKYRQRRQDDADEIKRLRLLIRCEQIEPPADVTDDQTTELAVRLAAKDDELWQLREALADARFTADVRFQPGIHQRQEWEQTDGK